MYSSQYLRCTVLVQYDVCNGRGPFRLPSSHLTVSCDLSSSSSRLLVPCALCWNPR